MSYKEALMKLYHIIHTEFFIFRNIWIDAFSVPTERAAFTAGDDLRGWYCILRVKEI